MVPEHRPVSDLNIRYSHHIFRELCVLRLGSCIFRCFPSRRLGRRNKLDYLGLCQRIWRLILFIVELFCMLIFAYSGPINSILSWKYFVPLSKLSYCAFLLHLDLLYHHRGMTRHTTIFSTYEIVKMALNRTYFYDNCFYFHRCTFSSEF
jgi:hypothetical protein